MASVVGSQVGGPNAHVTGTLDVDGVITAAGVVAPVTGNVTGNLSGLANGIDSTTLAPKASPTFTGTLAASIGIFSSTLNPQATLLTQGPLQNFPSAAQNITAVGNTITPGSFNQPLTANGTYVLTSTPTVAIPATGTEIELSFSGTGGVTLQHDSVAGLQNSKLKLQSLTRALVAGTRLGLVSDGTFLYERYFAPNLA